MAIIALILPAATSSGASTSAGNTIVIMEPGHAVSLDYQTDDGYDTASFGVVQNVYETLFYFNGNDIRTPVGVLATGYDVSGDGLDYTIYLRSGVKFHDGTDFNASAVKYSLDRFFLLDNLQAASNFVGTVKGYTAYNANHPNTTQADVDAYLAAGGVTVINDTCVRIALDSPDQDFIKMLSFPATSIMSPAFDQAHGGYNATAHTGNTHLRDHEAGTGPFVLSQPFDSPRLTLVKNADYWRSPAWADTVVIQEESDYGTRLAALKNGSADFIAPFGSNASDYDDPSVVVETGNTTLEVNVVAMNFNKAPFNNSLVRQAFVESFNATEYIRYRYNGYGVVPNGPIPPSVDGYNPAIPAQQFNPAHAKSLLVAAGYSNQTPVNISYYYNEGNSGRLKIGQMLKQQIESYDVGITIDLQALSTYQYIPLLNAGQLPIFAIGWQADYPSANNFNYAYAYSSGYFAHAISYANTTVDTAYDQVISGDNASDRQRLYDVIVRGVNADSAYIWTACPTEFQPHRSDIKGYVFNAMDCGIRCYGIYREPGVLGATYAGSTIPASMLGGDQYDVSVTFNNTGTLPWSEADLDRMLAWGDTEVLRVTGDCDNHGCGYPEYAIAPGTTVLPGESYTFNFSMTPQSTGSFLVGMTMAQNGEGTNVTGFGSSGYATVSVSPAEFDDSTASAMLVNADIPDTVIFGHTYTGNITFMNTGPVEWNNSSYVHMLVWGSTDELGIIGNADIYDSGYEEFAIPAGTSVQPGGTYTWNFSFTPVTAGYTCIGLTMAHNRVAEGSVVGFGQQDFESIIVTPASFDISLGNAWYQSNTVPPAMEVGQTYNVSVTYMNDGWAPWSEADNVRLLGFGDTAQVGMAGDCDNYSSGYPEYGIAGDPVLLWQTHTWNFTVTPTAPGNYMVGFAMVQNNGSTVTPFGGYGYATVDVAGSQLGDITISAVWSNSTPINNALITLHGPGGVIGDNGQAGYSYTWHGLPKGYYYATASYPRPDGVSIGDCGFNLTGPVATRVISFPASIPAPSPSPNPALTGDVTIGAVWDNCTPINDALITLYGPGGVIGDNGQAGYSYTWHDLPQAYYYATVGFAPTPNSWTMSDTYLYLTSPSAAKAVTFTDVSGNPAPIPDPGARGRVTVSATWKNGATVDNALISLYDSDGKVGDNGQSGYSYTWNDLPQGYYYAVAAYSTPRGWVQYGYDCNLTGAMAVKPIRFEGRW